MDMNASLDKVQEVLNQVSEFDELEISIFLGALITNNSTRQMLAYGITMYQKRMELVRNN
jgi:hypothetical protein